MLLLFMVTQNSGSPGAGSPGQAVGNSNVPSATQTMITFSTQTAPDILPRITVADAKALYDAGNVKIIDVREKSFYDQGHIKGATSVPQTQIATRIKDVPKDGTVVLYCDCPHDEESAGTAYTLRSAGYTNMKVLEGPQAYSLWKSAGYPVEP